MLGVLEGMRILELSHSVPGAFCSKILADFGADVIKIEPPGQGDPARRREPFADHHPHPEKSGLFLYLNTSKRGITLDISVPSGKELFLRLIKTVDVLVEDNQPKLNRSLGIDYPQLKEINPSLVVTSVTPFGQTGPYRDFKAYDLNVAHSCTEGYTHPGGGEYLDRPPVRPGHFVTSYTSGITAAIGTLAAYYYAMATGRGQQVDVSGQEAGMRVNYTVIGNYTLNGRVDSRGTKDRSVGERIRCKDGYLEFVPWTEGMKQKLVNMLGNPDWANADMFQDIGSMQVHIFEVNDLFEQWASDKTVDEVEALARAANAPAVAYYTTKKLFDSDQLRLRKFFVPVEHSVAGTFLYPSLPYKLAGVPTEHDRPAPLLGQYNEEVYKDVLGLSSADLVKLRQAMVI